MQNQCPKKKRVNVGKWTEDISKKDPDIYSDFENVKKDAGNEVEHRCEKNVADQQKESTRVTPMVDLGGRRKVGGNGLLQRIRVCGLVVDPYRNRRGSGRMDAKTYQKGASESEKGAEKESKGS